MSRCSVISLTLLTIKSRVQMQITNYEAGREYFWWSNLFRLRTSARTVRNLLLLFGMIDRWWVSGMFLLPWQFFVNAKRPGHSNPSCIYSWIFKTYFRPLLWGSRLKHCAVLNVIVGSSSSQSAIAIFITRWENLGFYNFKKRWKTFTGYSRDQNGHF